MSETPSSRSLIGVAVAVGGNVLISVALNCQKLAHLRLNGQNPHEQHSKRDEVEDEQSIDEEDQGQDPDLGQEDDGDRGRLSNGYGSTDVRVNMGGAGSTNWPGGTYGIKAPNGAPGDADGADDDTQAGSDDGSDHGPSTRFLRSKLWWLGMGLMIVGEGGNFLCELQLLPRAWW